MTQRKRRQTEKKEPFDLREWLKDEHHVTVKGWQIAFYAIFTTVGLFTAYQWINANIL